MHVLPAIATATWTDCETMSDRCWSVPPGDLRPLKEQVRRFEVVEYDDVHSSPLHVAEARLWAAQRALASGLLAERSRLSQPVWLTTNPAE